MVLFTDETDTVSGANAQESTVMRRFTGSNSLGSAGESCDARVGKFMSWMEDTGPNK